MQVKDIDAKAYPRQMVMGERLTWSDLTGKAIGERWRYGPKVYSVEEIERASLEELIESLKEDLERFKKKKEMLKHPGAKIALVKGNVYYQDDTPTYDWFIFRDETDEEYIDRVQDDIQSKETVKLEQEDRERKQYEALRKKFGG